MIVKAVQGRRSIKVGMICWKGRFWAWSERVKEWWMMRAVTMVVAKPTKPQSSDNTKSLNNNYWKLQTYAKLNPTKPQPASGRLLRHLAMKQIQPILELQGVAYGMVFGDRAPIFDTWQRWTGSKSIMSRSWTWSRNCYTIVSTVTKKEKYGTVEFNVPFDTL